MALDPQLVPLLEMMGQPGMPKLSEMSPADVRAGYEAAAAVRSDDGLKSVEDRTISGPGGELPIRVYRPDVNGTPPVVVFFHGGGWTIGSIASHDAVAAQLAVRTGAVVVSVEYRLAPEAKFPAPLDDCHAATAWVAGHAEELGVDASRLAIAGDSAGGNLAAAVALVARDQGPAICFQALIYPVVDHLTDWPSYAENAEGYMLERTAVAWFTANYLASDADAADWRASPIRSTDLAGLPPALVITANFDPLRDEGEAYGRRLGEAGVPVVVHRYDGMIHGFFGMPGITQGDVALDEVATALRDAFKV